MRILILILISSFTFAARVSVIDSGVDYKHQSLANKMWMNPIDNTADNRDQDGNGYEDDIYGWNFGDNNSDVIDYKYLGTFSEDPKKFFEIQGRSFLGMSTKEDSDWVQKKRSDEKFLKEMQIFGNFFHGTHVAGIVAQDNDEVILQALKLLPTEVKLPFIIKSIKNFAFSKHAPLSKESIRERLLKSVLTMVASQQSRTFIELGDYLHASNMEVANGSFGIGYHQAARIIGMIYPIVFFKKADKTALKKYSKFFVNTVADLASEMMVRSAGTLFVFAAGNDGLDNEEFGTSPANIQMRNSITVAASLGRRALANFSNYGKTLVHVAAPGVIINSAIPGDDFLRVSGTSQAAPYVANVAAMVKDANPSLLPSQIKDILIKTVDKKEFLKGKVLSEGIVNKDRAVKAAELSTHLDLETAIEQASEVADMIESDIIEGIQDLGGEVLSPVEMTKLYSL